MGFEDDMIEDGYSDEQEYLDKLLDDYEEKYKRQVEQENAYNDDTGSYYDEEEEQERLEKMFRKEREKQWVVEWKKNNPDLAIIWWAYFRNWSYYVDFCPGRPRLNEYNELKKWINERKPFERIRQKEEWLDYSQELFLQYENKLFQFYFPEDEIYINMSIISQQAHELSLIESLEPSLWKNIISRYVVDQKLLEYIEEIAFWETVYNREMDYEYWKDSNIEQYDQYAKNWIENNNSYVYGDWVRNHKKEEIEWKKTHNELWKKYKLNYEIREKNKFIELIIDKYKTSQDRDNVDLDKSRVKLKRVYINLNNLDSRHKIANPTINDWADDCDDYYGDNNSKAFLPDLESTSEKPFNIGSLDKELYKFIQDSIRSLDMNKISKESSMYADKVLTQLWIYTNRDGWAMEEVKKQYKHIFIFEKKYSDELLTWWKEKYPAKWDVFLKEKVSVFRNNFEIVMKFRLWALDGNKEKFFLLAGKYLSYWRETIKLMNGFDIKVQLRQYFHDNSLYKFDVLGEGVDYLKKCFKTSDNIDFLLRELQDNVIWNLIYKKNHQETYDIEYMYKSLNNRDDDLGFKKNE